MKYINGIQLLHKEGDAKNFQNSEQKLSTNISHPHSPFKRDFYFKFYLFLNYIMQNHNSYHKQLFSLLTLHCAVFNFDLNKCCYVTSSAICYIKHFLQTFESFRSVLHHQLILICENVI